MPQVPGLKRLQHRSKLDHSGMDFLLVIYETIGAIVWDGIVVFANVGQDSKKSFNFGLANLPKHSVLSCYKEGNEIRRMLCDVAMNQVSA